MTNKTCSCGMCDDVVEFDKPICKMVFEYTDSMGYTTRVEKTFEEGWNITPFDTLLTEIAMALKATGFSQESIDKSIDYPR